MENYLQHINYDISHLSLKDKEKLIRRAFDAKFNWWVDKLECRESLARQRVEMSFDDVMKHLTERAYVTVIHRQERYPDGAYMEIGFSSMESPVDYFLWIQVPLSLKDEFTKDLSRK